MRNRDPFVSKLAFTLIELLVVIAIIAVLAALLFPAVQGALIRGQALAVANDGKQLWLVCTQRIPIASRSELWTSGQRLQTIQLSLISSRTASARNGSVMISPSATWRHPGSRKRRPLTQRYSPRTTTHGASSSMRVMICMLNLRSCSLGISLRAEEERRFPTST